MQSMTEIYICAVHPKYCPNANNPVKKWLFLIKQASLSIIHKSVFLDIKFIRYFYHVIWVEKHENPVHLFMGHPVYIFLVFFYRSFKIKPY